MKRQHVSFWTGGHPDGARGCEGMAEALPDLLDPGPLHRSALIEYYWGETRFEIVAAACSVRTTPWQRGQMTWLHCKAMQTSAVKPDEPTGMMMVLIPAHYVTAIGPGPTFRIARRRRSDDVGVFPPTQPPPLNALPLPEVERVLAELLTSERN
jgi:hypothetical protein